MLLLTSFELIKFYIHSGCLKDFTAGESLVLLCLASCYSHISGCSFPSQDFIANKTGLTRQTVNECVKKLKNAKIIYVEKIKSPTGKLSNKYSFPHSNLKNFDHKNHKDFVEGQKKQKRGGV